MPQEFDKVTTRSLSPKYYQRLGWVGNKVVEVAGYIRKKGKDERIYVRKTAAKKEDYISEKEMEEIREERRQHRVK